MEKYMYQRVYRKYWTLNPGRLQVGPRDSKMSRLDQGPGTPKVRPKTQDSKIFK